MLSDKLLADLMRSWARQEDLPLNNDEDAVNMYDKWRGNRNYEAMHIELTALYKEMQEKYLKKIAELSFKLSILETLTLMFLTGNLPEKFKDLALMIAKQIQITIKTYKGNPRLDYPEMPEPQPMRKPSSNNHRAAHEMPRRISEIE